MDAIEYIDADEGREFAASHACLNCGATSANGAYLNDFWTADDRHITLCDDCAEAERLLEAQADQLAALPSCAARQRLIDAAETTARLVNVLRAHDLAQCVCCASTRATVATDRLFVHAAAVCCGGVA